MQERFDVVVVGAGPSGALASALLNKKGYRVLVLERAHFPRFSIGESLLPQSMAFLEEAGFLEAVQAQGFQFKNGAAFGYHDQYETFDFTDKLSVGWGTTFQVQRDQFDKVLADEASKQGVTIRYGQTVTSFNHDAQTKQCSVKTVDEQGVETEVVTKFVLDASGYGKVLPKLLCLEKPSIFEPRTSLFTHIEDNINDATYDREKILITVHPQHRDIWFWLIPFKGRASIGVVASEAIINEMAGESIDKLTTLIKQSGRMEGLLKNAKFDTRIGSLTGYASDVTHLYGPGFALLGNAGEFLDPVFSSGVTIAFKSAELASKVVDLELKGEVPDWQQHYVKPLQQGVNTFKEFVAAWYDGRLQDIIFSNNKNVEVKRMISSILAGYAWDMENPYVKDVKRLNVLAELCQKA
jgi:flavin-dependent dehydrogenase